MGHDFDGFSVNLYQDDDKDWLAHLVELPNISAFGPTPDQALGQLAEAWQLTKESYAEKNEPVPLAPSRKEYSGQFNVRIDRRVHRQLATEASRAGISLNALVAQKLSKDLV